MSETPVPVLQVNQLQTRFKTRNGDVHAVNNVSFELKPGQTLGLVGPSGAGKSTIARILFRFYDIQGGQVTIDGQDIAGVTQDSLRAQIGMVTQDTSLLHRSVRDNLLYGRPDADESAMRQAARNAEAEEFILGLNDAKGRTGYDAHVGERGVKLSGGQRQRIAIARALACRPQVLVADEAVSALDVSVQAQILQLLRQVQQQYGLGLLFITHDLRVAAQLCDSVIVMHQGQIVERGATAQLYAQPQHAYTRSLMASAPGVSV